MGKSDRGGKRSSSGHGAAPFACVGAVRVLVVEDDDAVRAMLVEKLEAAGFDAADAVATVASARRALASRPSVVCVDLELPDGSGVDVIDEARALGVPALVLSVHGDDASVFGALRAGASGYCLKSDGCGRIDEAIRVVLAGGAAIAPGIARRMLDFFRGAGAPPQPVAAAPGRDAFDPATLTDRERELMELFAAGCTYAEVAQIVDISINTVRHHVRGLYEKLHVNSKAEAVALLLRSG